MPMGLEKYTTTTTHIASQETTTHVIITLYALDL